MFILKIMLNQKYCQAWGHENIINETLNMINSYFDKFWSDDKMVIFQEW